MGQPLASRRTCGSDRPTLMLSLSMIVRNEASRLERCLESVAGFVDDMVVVYTGSMDATVAVAERLGARVHRIEWPGDFAPARNQALRWTRGDWVLTLDADEWLLPEAREPLRQLMEHPDALLINLLRHEQGAKQSPYSSVSRLFRRHPAIHWSRPYHAMVDDSVHALRQREPHWRILQWQEPALAHDGYRSDRIAGGDKAARLRRAMEADLRAHPGDPYASAKLGGLELGEGHLSRAVALLEEGLAHCPSDAHAQRYELMLHLAMAHGGTDPTKATALYQGALALPLDPRLTLAARLNLAALMVKTGQLQAAAELCTEATRTAPEVALGWYNLGLIHRQQGDLPSAIATYQRAIHLDPDHAEAHQNLAVARLMAGDIEAARRGFRHAIALLMRQGHHEVAEGLRSRAGALIKLEP